MLYSRFETIWDTYFIIHTIMGSGEYKFVDLTLPLNNLTSDFEHGTSKQLLDTTVAEGTRIESPYYEERGIEISEIPIEKLMVQLIFVDVSLEVEDNPKYTLSKEDLNSLLNKEVLNQMSLWPTLILIKFGWSKYYNMDDKKYFGYDEDKVSYNGPVISSEAAEWLTNCEMCNNVVGIGTDLPSLYIVNNGSTSPAVPNILSKAPFYIITGLNLNESLPISECVGLLSPKKTEDDASVPLMIFGLCPKEPYDANRDDVQPKREKRHTQHVPMFEHRKLDHVGCRHHKHEDKHDNMSSETQINASSVGNIKDKLESLPQKIIGGSIDKIKNKILP